MHIGESSSLARLFAPTSVALVGASPDTSRYGGRLLKTIREFGFTGSLWPVNPRYPEIDGLPCYPSLRELPGVPYLVGIVVSADRVFDMVKDCAAIGAGHAVIFTAGFGELGTAEAKARQDELTAYARAHGLRLFGPNCNGFINWRDRFCFASTGSIVGQESVGGRIGIVSQSGGAGQVNLMWRALKAGLKIGIEASCGNEADIGTIDVLEYFVDDPGTDIILMVVEQILDGDRLRRAAAKAAERGKPILIQKLGRSQAGTRASAQHTGAITGNDALHDAAFRQMGIIRVDETKHLYQAAMLLQQGRKLTADGVSMLAVSGGNIVIAADQTDRLGVSFPDYSVSTREAVGQLIPGYISFGNPTDLSPDAIGNPERFRKVLEAIAADPGIGITLPIITIGPQRDIDAVLAFAKSSPKPAGLVWNGCAADGSGPESDKVIDGVPVFRDVEDALRAANVMVRWSEAVKRLRRPLTERPAKLDISPVAKLPSKVSKLDLEDGLEKALGVQKRKYGLSDIAVAVVKDPSYGWIIAGLKVTGRDAVWRLPRLGIEDAREMLAELTEAVDERAAEMVLRAAWLVLDLGDHLDRLKIESLLIDELDGVTVYREKARRS